MPTTQIKSTVIKKIIKKYGINSKFAGIQLHRINQEIKIFWPTLILAQEMCLNKANYLKNNTDNHTISKDNIQKINKSELSKGSSLLIHIPYLT